MDQKIPKKYEPISAWGYVAYQLLFAIPLVGFIFLIVFSFTDTNLNRRNFARSYFCVLLIMAILTIISLLVFLILVFGFQYLKV